MQSYKENYANKSEMWMARALQLARLGAGTVSPNPMVGCVIVHNGQIIGEGWHKKYGEAHAEVNAVNSVMDKSLLTEADVYVTLEPCSHFGKTPPCADLLVKHAVKRVIICNVDSNPLVGGKGIAKLQAAGIAVETGILAEQGRALNKRFFTFIEKQRPYIILKWAETADGFIAKENFEAVQISNALSRRVVHKMRSEEDAIMIGTNTARYDNPSLNNRFWTGKNPLRIVIDKDLSLDKSLHIFDGSQPTIYYNLLVNKEENNVFFVKIEQEDFLSTIIQDLTQRKVQSLIVEGGSKLLQSFIDATLWDEAIVLQSKKILERGIAAPKIKGVASVSEKLGSDNILTLYHQQPLNQ
ncbi:MULTISPECIES: bifunctional diaminohydroxyphosphoribosylaminopyrimidine deaminase/5-amino-6-(5-phosphoribosylamino)uracil reductase RibD [unclassified Arcicella]|uniref:bifunctional diaminohydroxyphosphoribosylaminopyrimidine deaminase/5-amino-6-(5-phosphoribosylamino)uracil reductase RibD n=1 Tax=unclassified Arcicella TaxID=2644986 RepID=UPI0028584934|nr:MULTISPECIES: bifunctional diaminohydroxyphosphoribosylaminopyrimidine deaminase/5-amino-6-(5-phosphoribosylamino)uracil reductase RibD [unclassified Arcicella]MDR6561403.1 diaminohydroxyphosphoribosylaminopyrimidine deaminase/5-amino-6-(5-phosphoribosylamino)uracil reductase [Arcicella sp. BE51]MDR6811287.1 diaminohydroxyphosphoribosylaminopyrimidine deaminase/5-amino-6-(5-phosphoribosylamino)uracil reductase [Arcicella sp. BE140]MDR6822637.1 diaminohydroxyphosphoribosylaminopyrimidine deami